jgi:hypothetical protein
MRSPSFSEVFAVNLPPNRAPRTIESKGRLTGRWKARSLEQVLRVVHLITCLAGGLAKPGQNINWISDKDDILAKFGKSKDIALLLSKFSSHYVRHPLGELLDGTLTSKADPISRWLWLAPGVLRRSVVVFENQDGIQYSVSRLEMKDPEYHG